MAKTSVRKYYRALEPFIKLLNEAKNNSRKRSVGRPKTNKSWAGKT